MLIFLLHQKNNLQMTERILIVLFFWCIISDFFGGCIYLCITGYWASQRKPSAIQTDSRTELLVEWVSSFSLIFGLWFTSNIDVWVLIPPEQQPRLQNACHCSCVCDISHVAWMCKSVCKGNSAIVFCNTLSPHHDRSVGSCGRILHRRIFLQITCTVWIRYIMEW